MRPGIASVVLVAALTAGGCGASAPEQVAAKVRQFADAAKRRDYHTICDQVLAPALVSRLTGNGIACEQAMEVALGSVQEPTISVGKVTVNGDKATAITLSMARNQPSELDAIKLVQTDSGWRISALASPLR